MKIEAKDLTKEQQHEVWLWLQANGCRWMVPLDSPIYVHGRWIIVETFLFRHQRNDRKRSTKIFWQWPNPFPTQTRRFRQRVPLRLER